MDLLICGVQFIILPCKLSLNSLLQQLLGILYPDFFLRDEATVLRGVLAELGFAFEGEGLSELARLELDLDLV